MADDDDVPPLEDMSDMLNQVEKLKQSSMSSTSPIRSMKSSPVTTDGSKFEKNVRSTNSSKTTKNPATSKPETFGGMKKGFLFSSGKSKDDKTSQQKEQNNSRTPQVDIPLIKAKDPAANSLKMPEVEEALSSAQSFLSNKEWITDDLLSKIEKNEGFAKKLTNPKFMQAISEFQTNPQAAIRKYQDNAEMQTFLKDFCALLGDHFSRLGENQPGASQQKSPTVHTSLPQGGADISVLSSTNPKQATSVDESKMQEILADAEVRAILMDSQIQTLFELLRRDPNEGQRMLKDAPADLQKKIRKLVDVGLLQFQR